MISFSLFFFLPLMCLQDLCAHKLSARYTPHFERTKTALGNEKKSGCLAALASKQAASTAKLQHNAFAHGGADVAMAQSCTAQ